VDVAEAVHGYRYVLRRYPCRAVDLGPLAVQAGPRPGGDFSDESLPYLPGSGWREVAGGLHLGWQRRVVGGQNLLAKVPGYQGFRTYRWLHH
jgi:hypothetical protein